MKLWHVVALALLLSPSDHAGKCTMTGNFIVCNGHIATDAETHALLPPEYGGKGASSVPTGKVQRSQSARREFMQLHPCPSPGQAPGKCHGYIIDHVNPLACGGADDPSNMQWQTVADAKAKDKWERKGCHK